jgi:hypothetical protein
MSAFNKNTFPAAFRGRKILPLDSLSFQKGLDLLAIASSSNNGMLSGQNFFRVRRLIEVSGSCQK